MLLVLVILFLIFLFWLESLFSFDIPSSKDLDGGSQHGNWEIRASRESVYSPDGRYEGRLLVWDHGAFASSTREARIVPVDPPGQGVRLVRVSTRYRLELFWVSDTCLTVLVTAPLDPEVRKKFDLSTWDIPHRVKVEGRDVEVRWESIP